MKGAVLENLSEGLFGIATGEGEQLRMIVSNLGPEQKNDKVVNGCAYPIADGHRDLSRNNSRY